MPQGNLQAYAVEAEANLEKFATGLASAGADANTLKEISAMADRLRILVKTLGQGQEQTGDLEPPEQQPQSYDMNSAVAALHGAMQR